MLVPHRPALRQPLRFFAFSIGVACLCLAAAQPFTLNQMPYSADGLLQLHRTVAVEHSLRVDHPLWPRFSSGLVYGYGAPLFNFFPPLAYYPAVLAHRLGMSFLSAWLFSMSAFTLLAGVGMYLLGRLWTRSELGGWVAAAAYVYSPYLLFDSVIRGATAELAALAALPFAFYGITRLAFSGGRKDFLLALIALSTFIPLHTIVTLHGAALLAFYGLFLAWRAEESRAVLWRLALAGALALMLTAFYWLPALAERDTIKLPLIAEQLGHIDVTRHLRSLSEALALPQIADPTRQNQALPIAVGWPQLILAALGALLSLRAPHRRCRSLMIALWLVVGVLLFLNTSPSAWLWRNLPLIGFTQFPWRLLGLASLLLALMNAVGARLLWLGRGRRRVRLAVLSAFLVALMLYSMPWTVTLFRNDVDVDDIGQAQRFERESGQLALSSYAEYLPVSADAGQLDATRLIARFAESDVIPRLLPSATLDILSQDWRGTSAALRLRSAEAQTLVFDWLYVPGWAAAIDGDPIAVFPSTPAGLLALEAPAGEFDLQLSLSPTPAESLATALSGIGLASAGMTLLFWTGLTRDGAQRRSSSEPHGQWLLIFAAVGIALFLLKALALDAADTPVKRSQFGDVREAEALANFGNRIDLLAVEAPAEAFTGPTVIFKLYWRLHGAPLRRDYSSVIRMRDPQGFVVAQASAFAPGGLATSNWLPSAYIQDLIALEAPPFTPSLPEPYTFDLSLYDSESLEALSLINEAGDPQDDKFLIGALRLRPAEADFQEANVLPLPPDLGDELAKLVAAPHLPDSATAGDALQFSWVWRKLRGGRTGAMAQLLWLNESGAVAAAGDALPLAHGYDFVDWRVGEANRGHHQVIIPANLGGGRYRMGIRPLDAMGEPQGDILLLDRTMTVTAPQRAFEAPRFDFASGEEWANGIVLYGFSLGANGELELTWGSRRTLSESLRLFVHALDADARIVAQWDGVPVDWTRPTTGWVKGEYITTSHAFPLPTGEYSVAVGWYRPASGERIGVGAADALELQQLLVIE